jgi:hypothetical protein
MVCTSSKWFKVWGRIELGIPNRVEEEAANVDVVGLAPGWYPKMAEWMVIW